MYAKVEDAAAAQDEAMCLVVRQGRGSCVIDAHNDVLHAQACLLGDAALGDLREREIHGERERESEGAAAHKVRYTACGTNCVESIVWRRVQSAYK